MAKRPQEPPGGEQRPGTIDPRRRGRCGTMEEHRRLVRLDPEYRWRRRQIEQEVKEWTRRYAAEGLRTGLIRIPVVVHVIWHVAADNISDAKIQSQLDVINADFRRLNADATSTPAAFASVAADARIEFALAVRDPNCGATTGITRTQTTATGWTRNQTGMLSGAGGGHDPWDVTKYLNIWVCNYTDGLLGKGSFPGMPAAQQGVRCHYRAFGTVAPVDTPYHLGRTLTHEIGHYLNLLHIWGDDGSLCTGSDEVDDTPNQADETYTPPAFPAVSCSNGPNGDMFMNYMDYTDDGGMNMFTAGQSVRMDATLHTARASLLASDGLVPPAAVAGPDLWSKDVSDDIGAEPDASAQPMYISDDIWVRNDNDGIANQDHQNPEYGSPTTSVYVRVRNRGCSGTQSGTVQLYWAKASTGLSWPSPWDGSVTSPALMGASIGSQVVSVAGGQDEILVFPWSPPNPADYASFGADAGHFCLLSRIETAPGPGFGMTIAETGNLYANVANNNNIVWKNITVVDEEADGGRMSAAIVANFGRERQQVRLVFKTPKERDSMFDWGQVWFSVTKQMNELWQRSNTKLEGIKQLDDDTYRVLGPGATIGPIELRPGELAALRLRFVPDARRPLGVRVFTLDLEQIAGDAVIGGQRFVVKTRRDTRGVAYDRPATVFDGVGWVKAPGAGGCCCD
jgi:hypothetical protein